MDYVSGLQGDVNKILCDQAFIRQKLAMFWPRLLSKWKKSRAKRQNFLENVKDLFQFSDPLMELLVLLDERKVREQPRDLRPCLMPYLNQENLNQRACRMLQILHHRAFQPLEDWVAYDNSVIQRTWEHGSLHGSFRHGPIIIMHGATYGQFGDFDADAVHSGIAYMAPRAIHIIKAQGHLFRCLRQLTEILLPHSDESPPSLEVLNPFNDNTLPGEKWMKAIECEEDLCSDQLSFGKFWSHQPFCSPPHFDIEKLLDIAKGRATEAQDELWLLQTDSNYFYATLQSYLQGSKLLSNLANSTRRRVYNYFAIIVTVGQVTIARDWKWVADECEYLKQEMEKSTFEGRKKIEISSSHRKALCGLEMLLQRIDRTSRRDLLLALVLRGTFNPFLNDPQIEDSNLVFQKETHGVNRKGWFGRPFEDPLGSCFGRLCQDPYQIKTLAPSILFEKIDKLLAKSNEEQKRVSADVHRVLADLAAIHQMLDVLSLHRPYFDPEDKSVFNERTPPWIIFDAMVSANGESSKFEYNLVAELLPISKFAPPKGVKDKRWLVQRDTAHQNLSKLWKKVKDGYQRECKVLQIPQWCIDPQLETMDQADSPETLDFLEAERKLILNRSQQACEKIQSRGTKHIMSASDFNYLPQALFSKQERVTKTKMKTRPVSRQDAIDENAMLVEERDSPKLSETRQTLYTFPRKDKVWKILNLMFPTDEATGVTDWKDFTAAFTKFGFKASRQSGSAFTFVGEIKANIESETGKHSMNIHKPHPSTEMSSTLLRGIGRRCERRFGWSKESFAHETLEIES